MSAKTKVIDKGAQYARKMIREMKRGPYVKVGFPRESSENKKRYKFGSTVLDLAIIHEFGGPKTIERSFMRAAFKSNLAKYKNKNKTQLNRLVKKRTSLKQVLMFFGLIMVNDIKNFIAKRKVKPVSKRAEKQGGATLWDTGQLINSLAFSHFMNRKISFGGKVSKS